MTFTTCAYFDYTHHHLLCLPFPLLLIPFLFPIVSSVCVFEYMYMCARTVCVPVSVYSSVCPSHWVPLRVKVYSQKKKDWVPHCGYPLGKLSLPSKRWGLTALSPSTAGITGSILWQFPLYYFSPLTIGNFVSFGYNALQVTELEVFGQTQISLLVPPVSVPVVLWVGSAAAVCCLGVADILKVMS